MVSAGRLESALPGRHPSPLGYGEPGTGTLPACPKSRGRHFDAGAFGGFLEVAGAGLAKPGSVSRLWVEDG